MTPAPALSVVIPTHDRLALLERALASVRSQTFADLEVIVVDDGSTDGTAAAVERVAAADARVRLVTADAPGGASAARNTGVDHALGDYVAFCDDDDEWLPRKAEAQLDALRSEPDLVAVSCQYEIVGSSGPPRTHRGPVRCSFAELLWCDFMGGASFALLRRSAFTSLPRFDPTLEPCEDWDLYLRCAQTGPVAVVDDVLCRYRDHPGARLTSAAADRVHGRAALVARWGEHMSAACRAYHDARARTLVTHGAVARARLASRLLTTTPRAVSRVIAEEAASARVGRLTGDAGRSMRRLHRLVQAIERARE